MNSVPCPGLWGSENFSQFKATAVTLPTQLPYHESVIGGTGRPWGWLISPVLTSYPSLDSVCHGWNYGELINSCMLLWISGCVGRCANSSPFLQWILTVMWCSGLLGSGLLSQCWGFPSGPRDIWEKHWPKTTNREGGNTVYNARSQAITEGSQGRDLSRLLSYRAQGYLPRDDDAHSRLDHPHQSSLKTFFHTHVHSPLTESLFLGHFGYVK